MARAITAGELTNLRKDNQFTQLYMGIFNPTTVATARVNGDPSDDDKLATLAIDTWAWGSGYSNAYADMLVYVGSSAGAYDKGMARLRSDLSGTPTSMDLGEISEISWSDDDYITIKDEFNMHPKHLAIDGSGEVFMDYDVDYTDQHDDPDPVPVLGPYLVPTWLTGATVDTEWNAASSWVLSGSITGYSWSAPGASASSGMATATPTITYDAAGTYRVSCTVSTATKSFIGYRYVLVYDTDNPPMTDFVLESCQGNWDSGGWVARVVCYANVATTDIRDRSAVALFTKDFYGGTEVDMGPIGDRENTLLIGWIDGESIEWDPEQGTVSFDIQGPQFWLAQMHGFPSGYESVSGTPAAWTEIQTLTPRKGFWAFLHWRTTLTRMLDVFLTADTREISLFNASPGTLWDQLGSEAWATILAKPVFDRYGRLWVEIEPNLVPTGDRSGWPSVMTVTTEDLRRPITIERQTVRSVGLVDVTGIYYVVASATGTPYFSLAPGHVPSWHGGGVERFERLALSSQGQSNTLAGLIFGWRNNEYPSISLPFGQNNRMIDITPHQYIHITVAAGDTERGISGTLDMFPRTVSFTHDPVTGVLLTDVQAEGETDETGAPNMIGDPPPEPPPGADPDPPPDDWDPIPETTSEWPATVLAATMGDTSESRVSNIYKTTNFSGPGDGDPTWTALACTSLPATRYIKDMDNDPDDKGTYIYVMISTTSPTTSTDMEIWVSSNSGSTFSQIYTNALVTTDMGTAGKMYGMGIDDANAGVLWVAVKTDVFYITTQPLAMSGCTKFTSYGGSRTYYAHGTWSGIVYYIACSSVKASGSNIFVGGGWSAGGGPGWTESSDGGSNWSKPVIVGISGWVPNVQYSDVANYCYINSDGTSHGDDLAYISGGARYLLQDGQNIPPQGKYRMWISRNDPDIARIMQESGDDYHVMFYTDDDWATVTVGADPPPVEVQNIAWAGDLDDDDKERAIVLNQKAGDGANEEAGSIYVTDDEGTTYEDKSGASPGTAPYTDSIPCIEGGVRVACIVDRDYYH